MAAHRVMREELQAAAAALANASFSTTPGASQPPSAPDSPTSYGSGGGGGGGGGDGPLPPFAAALGRALRMLAAQLKLLRVDAANGRLRLLAAQLAAGGGAVHYLQVWGGEGERGLGTALRSAVAARRECSCVQQQGVVWRGGLEALCTYTSCRWGGQGWPRHTVAGLRCSLRSGRAAVCLQQVCVGGGGGA